FSEMRGNCLLICLPDCQNCHIRPDRVNQCLIADNQTDISILQHILMLFRMKAVIQRNFNDACECCCDVKFDMLKPVRHQDADAVTVLQSNFMEICCQGKNAFHHFPICK